MERLAQIVSGRRVGVLLHGSSVSGVARVASALDPGSVVWIGLNHFRLLEDELLRRAGHDMSVVFCCADGEVERRRAQLIEFLERGGTRLLITRKEYVASFTEEAGVNEGRVLPTDLPPLWPYPNSLTLLLRVLVRARPEAIVLFGADGYLGEDDQALPTYYGSSAFRQEGRLSGVLRDTLLFNAHTPKIFDRWREEHGFWPAVLNCSPGTCLRSVPAIDAERAVRALRGEQVTGDGPKQAVLLPTPARRYSNDPAPELVVCANAARIGDLVSCRMMALKALARDPALLSPLGFRALQTNRAVVEKAISILQENFGAADSESSQHWRWKEFQAELTLARQATASWFTWS